MPDSRISDWIARAGDCVALAGFLLMLLQSRNELAIRFLILSAAMILLCRAGLRPPATAAVAFTAVVATVAATTKLYEVPGVDTVMHTLVPAAIVIALDASATRVPAAALALTAGLAWEVYEWLAVNLVGIGSIRIDAPDTAADLAATVVGALAATSFGAARRLIG